jgi:hypothetical protein
MCAIDALGMSAMLGRPVTITAAEPDTGGISTVHAEGSLSEHPGPHQLSPGRGWRGATVR